MIKVYQKGKITGNEIAVNRRVQSHLWQNSAVWMGRKYSQKKANIALNW